MTSEPSAGGNVRALILEVRQAAGLSQSELAERAGVSRSTIISAEAGTSLPTMEVCLKLADALSVPFGAVVRAHGWDSVFAADPTALARVQGELWEGNYHWEAIAQQQGVRFEGARYVGTVDEDGNLTCRRRLSGCRAVRPCKRIYFRDRIVGERAPLFAVKGAPHGVGFSMHVSVEGEWAQHRVELERALTPADGPFAFEFETYMERAFLLDLEDHNRRRAAEGLAPLREWVGDWRWAISYAFEKLEFSLVFPKWYLPEWREPTATWGVVPLSECEAHEVTKRSCRTAQMSPAKNKASLVLERPSPGYTFGIRWCAPGECRPIVKGEAK